MKVMKYTKRIAASLLLIGCLFQNKILASEIEYYLKNFSADSVGNVLLVDKSQQRLLVLKSRAPQSVTAIDTFRITTGKIDGNKEKEGDKKTPEGIYRIVAAIPGNQLPPKYGPMAFVLDYPNRVDRILNRNGSNIWIHGRDEEIIDRQTEGCISLENRKLLELSRYISLRETPVIIIDSLYHNGHSLNNNEKFNLTDSLFVRWRESWETGDIEGLERLLSDHFQTQSKQSKKAFIATKNYLETRYAWKEIGVDQLRFLQSDEEALINFQQDYLCPVFFSRGDKELHLLWSDSSWSIIGESFTATRPRVYVSTAVNSFLRAWIHDWEAGQFEPYIAHYDSTFSSQSYPTLHDWAEYKKQVFSKSTAIKVVIEDVSVSSSAPRQWRVRFRQKYSSGNYRDTGQKTLLVTGHPLEPDQFKIINEEWEPID